MPKITLYFPDDFDDPAWAGSSFCLEAPDDDRHHGRPGEWVIGRHPAADLTIATRTISAKHCALAYSYAADRWSIQDLGSTNGTRLNGDRLNPGDPRPVAVGDRLHIGPNLVMVVEDENDTINDDGPTTVVGLAPLDHRTGDLVEHSRTYADAVYLGASWLVAPSTLAGKVYRLIVVGVVVAVIVAVMGAF